MEKNELVLFLNDIFIPIGFKRKGNNWIYNGDVLTKMLNLQQSNYGNIFYINYGYIIRGLELTTTMHIFKSLGSTDEKENKKNNDLLNLENTAERMLDLKSLVCNKIVSDFKNTNVEEDLLNEIKNRPHLNNIPLVVKEHFNLPV